MRPLALFALLVLSGGCRAAIPVDRFDCTLDTDCPPGQRCVGGLCGTGTPGIDSGLPDAPVMDAGPPDSPPIDTSPDTSLDAGFGFRVRVLNAIGDVGGVALPSISVNFRGDVQMPAFGCMATYYGIEASTIDIDASVDGMVTTLPVIVEANTLVIVARNSTGAVAPYVVSPDVPFAATGPANIAVQYIDLVRTTASSDIYITTDITDITGSLAPIEFGDASDPREFPTGTPFSVGIGYPDFLTPVILATFTTVEQTADAFVVLTGNADLHPGSAGGPRAIVVPPDDECTVPLLPDAQIIGLNLPQDRGFGRSVFVCQRGTGFTAVEIGPDSVTPTTSTYGGRSTFGLADTAAEACDAGARTINLTGAAPGRRYLVAVTGLIASRDPSSWDVTVIREVAADVLTAPGETPDHAFTFVHAASALTMMPVDLTPSAGVPILGVLAAGSESSLLAPASLATSYSVTEGATPHGTFLSPLGSTDPDGVFVVFIAQNRGVPAGPAPSLAFVSAPYAHLWTLAIRDPI